MRLHKDVGGGTNADLNTFLEMMGEELKNLFYETSDSSRESLLRRGEINHLYSVGEIQGGKCGKRDRDPTRNE